MAGCVTTRASVLGISAVHVCVHRFPVSVWLYVCVSVCLSVYISQYICLSCMCECMSCALVSVPECVCARVCVCVCLRVPWLKLCIQVGRGGCIIGKAQLIHNKLRQSRCEE